MMDARPQPTSFAAAAGVCVRLPLPSIFGHCSDSDRRSIGSCHHVRRLTIYILP
jgi:hypothetical protein